MCYKARYNLRCVLINIFCLFSFQQSQENPPQSLLQSNRGEDCSTSKNESEYSEHSSDAVDMKFCDGKDISAVCKFIS